MKKITFYQRVTSVERRSFRLNDMDYQRFLTFTDEEKKAYIEHHIMNIGDDTLDADEVEHCQGIHLIEATDKDGTETVYESQEDDQ